MMSSSTEIERDDASSNRHRALLIDLNMTFAENRYPLCADAALRGRIVLYAQKLIV
jgi:hypothetical protein